MEIKDKHYDAPESEIIITLKANEAVAIDYQLQQFTLKKGSPLLKLRDDMHKLVCDW